MPKRPTHKKAGETTNDSDSIFRRGGNDLMLQLSKDGNGYVGNYKVGFLLT